MAEWSWLQTSKTMMLACGWRGATVLLLEGDAWIDAVMMAIVMTHNGSLSRVIESIWQDLVDTKPSTRRLLWQLTS